MSVIVGMKRGRGQGSEPKKARNGEEKLVLGCLCVCLWSVCMIQKGGGLRIFGGGGGCVSVVRILPENKPCWRGRAEPPTHHPHYCQAQIKDK